MLTEVDFGNSNNLDENADDNDFRCCDFENI